MNTSMHQQHILPLMIFFFELIPDRKFKELLFLFFFRDFFILQLKLYSMLINDVVKMERKTIVYRYMNVWMDIERESEKKEEKVRVLLIFR